MVDILSQVESEVGGLTDEQIRDEMARLLAAKEKQRERQKEYNTSPEAKEKRRLYNEQRKDDPAVKAARKAYHERPEVKEKQRLARQKRAARQKAILKKAAELGITS
jgi:uncharacterized protein YhaN